MQAIIAAFRGQADFAAALAVEAEGSAASTGATQMLAYVHVARGLAALGDGRADDAYDEFVRIYDSDDPALTRCQVAGTSANLPRLPHIVVAQTKHAFDPRSRTTGWWITVEMDSVGLQSGGVPPGPTMRTLNHAFAKHWRRRVAGRSSAHAFTSRMAPGFVVNGGLQIRDRHCAQPETHLMHSALRLGRSVLARSSAMRICPVAAMKKGFFCSPSATSNISFAIS
jgi:hypothetical protein